MIDLTVEEAKAVRAVIMGDDFSVELIDSVLEKIEEHIELEEGR